MGRKLLQSGDILPAMRQYDTLGRATFHNKEKDLSIAYTDRALDWFEFVNLHGHANSEYLYQVTRDRYRCPKRAREAIRKLVKGGYLEKTAQANDSKYALSSYYVYKLTNRGKAALIQENRYVEALKPSGPFKHQYLTACITGSLQLSARKHNLTYIPAHEILERSDTTLSAVVKDRTLRPDQMCGLDYGQGVRFFMIEADRGTEPGETQSKARNKTYASSIDQYVEFIKSGDYKKHYGVTSQMKVLYIFISRADELKFQGLIEKKYGKCPFILTQTVGGFFPFFKPEKPYTQLLDEPWNRANMAPFDISVP